MSMDWSYMEHSQYDHHSAQLPPQRQRRCMPKHINARNSSSTSSLSHRRRRSENGIGASHQHDDDKSQVSSRRVMGVINLFLLVLAGLLAGWLVMPII